MLKIGDFKNKYADTWVTTKEKERYVADFIRKNGGVEVEFSGFGAGDTTFYQGSAEDYGFEKGDPDLHIEGTNIYIEVTGQIDVQNIDHIYEDLWFRPDKILNAISHPEKETWLCHVFRFFDDKAQRVRNITRLILVDEVFISNFEEGRFAIREVHTKRGGEETFVAISADYEGILYIRDFCQKIAKAS